MRVISVIDGIRRESRLGKLIRQERKERGIDVTRLADDLGRPVDEIALIEENELGEVEALGRVLDVLGLEMMIGRKRK